MEVCALGYSRRPFATYLSDFRWGRLNFDTDAAVERRTDQGDSHRGRPRELDRRLPFKTNIRQ